MTPNFSFDEWFTWVVWGWKAVFGLIAIFGFPFLGICGVATMFDAAVNKGCKRRRK